MSNEYLPPIIKGPILVALSEACMGDYVEGRLVSSKEGTLLRSLLANAGIDSEECSFALWDNYPKSYSPTCIIAMGNEALKGLTKKSGVKKYRGQTLPLHESYGFTCSVYPTYSISDLKNVPMYRKTIVADLRNTQQGESEAVQFTYWETE